MFCIFIHAYAAFDNKNACTVRYRKIEAVQACVGVARFLFVHAVAGKDMIGIKNGDHDQCGKPRGEAAVVKNEATVHARGGGAYDCVDQSGKQALFPTVSSSNGAETRGECNAVDVYLGRKHPRKRFSEKGVYDANESG